MHAYTTSNSSVFYILRWMSDCIQGPGGRVQPGNTQCFKRTEEEEPTSNCCFGISTKLRTMVAVLDQELQQQDNQGGPSRACDYRRCCRSCLSVGQNADASSSLGFDCSISATAMAKPYLVTSAKQSPFFLSFSDLALERKFVQDHAVKARAHDLQVKPQCSPALNSSLAVSRAPVLSRHHDCACIHRKRHSVLCVVFQAPDAACSCEAWGPLAAAALVLQQACPD